MIIANTNRAALDDKDYYGNKRLEMAGHLLALVFEDALKRFNAEIVKIVEQNKRRRKKASAADVVRQFQPSFITNSFIFCISTGNWTLRRFHMDRQGVTQVLSRLSFISCYGMMTKLASQFEKSRKVSGPRSLQPSQFGMICPSDTPEGESCGLVKNFALLTHVTTDDEIEPLIEVCFNLGVEELADVPPHAIHRYAHVLVNGVDIGIHRQPALLAAHLRLLRRKGRIGEFVSVVCSSDPMRGRHEVSISAEGGRVCRPLIIVNHGQPALLAEHLRELYSGVRTLEDCLREGIVE